MMAVPFCTVPVCNNLLKVTYRRLKVSIQIQDYLPLHPVLLAIVLTAGLPLSGENLTAAYVVWLQGIMGKSSPHIFKLPLPTQICLLYSEGTTGRGVRAWNAESQLIRYIGVWLWVSSLALLGMIIMVIPHKVVWALNETLRETHFESGVECARVSQYY